MGYRDDNLGADERAEAALRRALAQLGEPQALEPPPALVAHTGRRLPALTPAQAARAARTAALARACVVTLLVALALLLVVGGLAALAGSDWMVRWFGDGRTGISRTLLTLQLLAKPLWRPLGAVGLGVALVGTTLLAGGGAAWWWMVRQSPRLALERGS